MQRPRRFCVSESTKTDRTTWSAARRSCAANRIWSSFSDRKFAATTLLTLVKFGSGISGAKFICLGDYANSRGAADMGLYPDLLPGYHPVAGSSEFHEEWGEIPQTAGLDLAGNGGRGQSRQAESALRGRRESGRDGCRLIPSRSRTAFVVVQDMFLTETAVMADVVLPAANAYEKSGTFTNTCGDLQLVKKAGEVTGTKADFEMIVRIADAMGFDVRKLVPFGGGTHADMGQSRGAQSGEADRHAVWLEAQGLEPKMSPFDPMAILDEIQRLVPGYDVSRVNLLAGNSEHTSLDEERTGRGTQGGFDFAGERRSVQLRALWDVTRAH